MEKRKTMWDDRKTGRKFRCLSNIETEVEMWSQCFEVGKVYEEVSWLIALDDVLCLLEESGGAPFFVDKECFELVEEQTIEEVCSETSNALGAAALEYNKSINIQIGKLIERQRDALILGDQAYAMKLEREMDYLAAKRYK